MYTLSSTRKAERADSPSSTTDQSAPIRAIVATKTTLLTNPSLLLRKEGFVSQPSRPWEDHRMSTSDDPVSKDDDHNPTGIKSITQDLKPSSLLLQDSEYKELTGVGIGRGSYIGPTSWKRTGVEVQMAFNTKLYKLQCGGRQRDRRRHGLLAPESESTAEFKQGKGVHHDVLPEEVAPLAASLERGRRGRRGAVVQLSSGIERSDEELGALWVWLKRRR